MIKDKIVVDIEIEAPVERVWEVLTKPEHVKEAFWGTELKTSWNVGESITYSGIWEGKPYEDKGVVKEFITNSKISMTYWSNFAGTEDKPENYAVIEYIVKASSKGTLLTVTQENFNSQEQREHSAQNWKSVLESMKKIAER